MVAWRALLPVRAINLLLTASPKGLQERMRNNFRGGINLSEGSCLLLGALFVGGEICSPAAAKPRHLLLGEAVPKVALELAELLGLRVTGGELRAASLQVATPALGNAAWSSSVWGFLN